MPPKFVARPLKELPVYIEEDHNDVLRHIYKVFSAVMTVVETKSYFKTGQKNSTRL